MAYQGTATSRQRQREPTSEEKSRIMVAIKEDDVEVLKQLHLQGVNVTNIIDDSKQNTSLHEAAYNGHYDIASCLLNDLGANVNAINKARRTPLHCASIKGHTNIVYLLVSNKADLNAKDKANRTPLMRAVNSKHSAIVYYFVKVVGMDPIDCDQEIVADLIKKGESVPVPVQYGASPFLNKATPPYGYQNDERRSPTTATQLHCTLADLKHQVDQLQDGHVDHDDQLASIHTTVGKMQRDVERFEGQMQDIMQKTEHVLASNQRLQDKLSCAEQHLPTVNPRWVVTHNQFEIQEEIGRGAWATVHKATFRGKIVAAKCLHKAIYSQPFRNLFQREMETALICQHKNIITFYGATLEGDPVILMELMDMSLRDAYNKHCVSGNQKPQILHHVAEALCFLHNQQHPVIHRDVSSANVLLKALPNGMWLAKLGDLGTAKVHDCTVTPGPGAIAYAAPEVASPKRHSPKMDVYSFGILILEVLTETFPYNNKSNLKDRVRGQFPTYYRLVCNCINDQPEDRPTMLDIMPKI